MPSPAQESSCQAREAQGPAGGNSSRSAGGQWASGHCGRAQVGLSSQVVSLYLLLVLTEGLLSPGVVEAGQGAQGLQGRGA